MVKTDKDRYTIEDQIVVGETMKAQLSKMQDVYPILDRTAHACVYERMDILFNTLLNTSVVQNRKKFDWNIHIIDNDEIKNAFTLPGGQIYIYKGLIKYLKTESELVAVLGNEIAYSDQELALNTLRAEHGNVVVSDLSTGKAVPNLEEMLRDLPYIQYDEATVLAADAISISLICPFQYDAGSLKSFVTKATDTNIEWVQSKKVDLEKRISNLETLTSDCGTDEATFEERYQSFLDKCLE